LGMGQSGEVGVVAVAAEEGGLSVFPADIKRDGIEDELEHHSGVLQFGLGVFAFGDVAEDAVGLFELAVGVIADSSVEGHNFDGAVFMFHFKFVVDFADLFEAREALSEGLDIGCGEEFAEPMAEDFGAGVAEGIEPGLVDFDEATVGVEGLVTDG